MKKGDIEWDMMTTLDGRAETVNDSFVTGVSERMDLFAQVKREERDWTWRD